MINQAAVGYHDLPTWPDVAPDPKVRDIEVTPVHVPSGRIGKKLKEKKSFYSDSDGSTTTEGADSTVSSGEESDEEDDEEIEESDNDEEESEEESEESEDEETESEGEESSDGEPNSLFHNVVKTHEELPESSPKVEANRARVLSETTEDSSEDEEESSEESSDVESSEEEAPAVKKIQPKKKADSKKKIPEKKKEVVNLLDLDDCELIFYYKNDNQRLNLQLAHLFLLALYPHLQALEFFSPQVESNKCR